MSWHTLPTKTTTHYTCWHYHAHIIAPIELIVNYEVKSLYLLKKVFSKTPATPCTKPRSPALTLHRRFPAPHQNKQTASPDPTKKTTMTNQPKTQRMPNLELGERSSALFFLPENTRRTKSTWQINTAPAVSPHSAATSLSKE